jgi:hypothetical protein
MSEQITRQDRIRLLLESWLDYLPPLQIARYGHQEPLSDDPMVRSVVEGYAVDAADGYRANLRALERLNHDEFRGETTREDPRWLRRERHLNSGSYWELESAMRHLQVAHAYEHRVLTRWYVDEIRVSTLQERDNAILLLSDYMPVVILLPAYVADRNGEPLHARIRLLAAEKPRWSQRRLAKSLGTSQATVCRALEEPKRRIA